MATKKCYQVDGVSLEPFHRKKAAARVVHISARRNFETAKELGQDHRAAGVLLLIVWFGSVTL